MANEPTTPTGKTFAELLYSKVDTEHGDLDPSGPTKPADPSPKTWAEQLYTHPTSAPQAAKSGGEQTPAAAPASTTNGTGTTVPTRLDAGGFRVPESIAADDPILADFRPLAKEFGPETAQKLIDMHTRALDSRLEAQHERTRAWGEECERDAEIGGAEFDSNVALAQGVLVKYGTLDLRQELAESDMGSNPGLVKLLVRIGRELAQRGGRRG